jgi:ribosome maturation factor RimP
MILSEEFASRLNDNGDVLEKLENYIPKGYGKAITVYVKKSNKCTLEDIKKLSEKLAA